MNHRSSRPAGTLRPRRRRRALAALAVVVIVTSGACVFPAEPPYPHWGPYGSRQGVIDKAQNISDRLEQYVKDYLNGTVPAAIPADILPDGYRKNMTNFRVQRESEINPATQWLTRPATPVNIANAPGLYSDPEATYLFLPNYFVPFGSKAIVTGQFPHSRFFSIQVSPSFQPEQYLYHQGIGVGENPIVDVDINPDPGSSNPFRVGANRNASSRNYTVTLDNKIGNAAVLDPAFRPPNFRAPGNTRLASGIKFTGPWGDPNYPDWSPLVDHAGLWDFGQVWVRYYVQDTAVGPMGGVALPKVTYQLPDGRKFFIAADISAMGAQMNKTQAVASEWPTEPTGLAGKDHGWAKNWGVLRNGAEVVDRLYRNGPNPAWVRNIEKGASGRGEDLPAPQNYESSASLTPYNNYLTRPMSLGWGKVAVLTGRKPTTPKTKNGQGTMVAAQARFWSIATYDDTLDSFDMNAMGPIGETISYVNDETIITDANGYYTIVYSKAEDRPANATAANGVTWVDWGPKATSGFFMRWMSVGPEWSFAKTPNEINLGRAASDRSSVLYNPTVMGQNHQNGWLGEYQPLVHYLPKAEFEALGTNVRWNQIPLWQ